LLIKRAFNFFFTSRKRTIKAALYNAQTEGLLVQRMINGNPRSDIKVVAFLDDGEKLIGKTIENTPVLRPLKNTFARLKQEGVELLILSDPYLRRQRLNELVDLSLEYNIRIQQVPPSRQWLNNTLETKQLKDINIEQLLER